MHRPVLGVPAQWAAEASDVDGVGAASLLVPPHLAPAGASC